MQSFNHTQQLLWLVLFKIIVEFKTIKMRRGWTSFTGVDSHQLANATVKQCVMLYMRNRKASRGAVTELLWSVHFFLLCKTWMQHSHQKGKTRPNEGGYLCEQHIFWNQDNNRNASFISLYISHNLPNGTTWWKLLDEHCLSLTLGTFHHSPFITNHLCLLFFL